MNRLPTELMETIADCVELDHDLTRRRTTLAGLSRTNKALHSVCNPRLYLYPIITSWKRMKEWTRVYISQVTPWNYAEGRRRIADAVVPQSISFQEPSASDDSEQAQAPLRPFHDCILLELDLPQPFFRNLVSFSASEGSPDVSVLVAALFGPLGDNRYTIRELHLTAGLSDNLVSFLVGGYGRMEWEWESTGTWCLVHDALRQIKGDAWVNSRLKEDWTGFSWRAKQEIRQQVDALAPIDFKIFDLMWWVEAEGHEAIALNILERSHIRSPPFSSLQSLKVTIWINFELYLVLTSSAFPCLSHLQLAGSICSSHWIDRDVKLIRLAITKRNGTISRPSFRIDYVTQTDRSLPNAFSYLDEELWLPVEEEEKEDEPILIHTGPNLLSLDLSLLTIGLCEDEEEEFP
ncbi:hypothetical protein JCM5350_003444 [Sporobolomyces pararoseus]